MFESHLWWQGKQTYIGSWASQDHAARAHDIAMTKAAMDDQCTTNLNYAMDLYASLLPALNILSFANVISLVKEHARTISPSALARGNKPAKDKDEDEEEEKDPRGPRSVNSRRRAKTSETCQLEPDPPPRPRAVLPSSSQQVHQPRPQRGAVFVQPSTFPHKPSATTSTLQDQEAFKHPLGIKVKAKARTIAKPTETQDDDDVADVINASLSLHLMRDSASKKKRARTTRMVLKEISSSSSGSGSSDDEEEEDEDEEETVTEDDDDDDEEEGSGRRKSGRGRGWGFKRRKSLNVSSFTTVRPPWSQKQLSGVFVILGGRKHPESEEEAKAHEKLARELAVKPDHDLKGDRLVLGGPSSAFSPPPPAPCAPLAPPPPPFNLNPDDPGLMGSADCTLAAWSPASASPLLLNAGSPLLALNSTSFLLLSSSKSPTEGYKNPPNANMNSLAMLTGNLMDLLPLWT